MYRYHATADVYRLRIAIREHRRIFEAICDGDGQVAEWLIRGHIRRAIKNLQKKANNTAALPDKKQRTKE